MPALLKPLLLLVLAFALSGASCKSVAFNVVVVGDSHSDPDREPALDWLPFAPFWWEISDHATAGMSCWQAIPLALADPHALHPNDHLVVFCGTNDAGRSDWDLEETAGWIEAAIQTAQLQGLGVTLVAPPPAFRDYPVDHNIRNLRLWTLRTAIFELAAQYGLTVADLWSETWALPDPESYFPDGLHFSGAGRYMAGSVIGNAVDNGEPVQEGQYY